MARGRAAQGVLESKAQAPAAGVAWRRGEGPARGQAPDVRAPGRARARRQRVRARESRLEVLLVRELLRTQELQQSEEPVHVVLERRRGQEEHVAAEARDGGCRAAGTIAGVSRRPPG